MTRSLSTSLLALAACIVALAPTSAASAATLDNTGFGTNGSISSFGSPNTLTYGQVFTAPITGTMTSFSLTLNGGVGALFGGVGTWNGTAAFGSGFGSPVNLYQSPDTPAPGAGAYTFSPNIAVTAGQRYVAYLSVFGVAGANTTTTMPTATNDGVAGIDYFVFNNSSDPRNNQSWNYFGDRGDVLFSAEFSAGVVPEPATWAMMIGGFGLVGAAMRRRTKVSVSYA